MANGVKELHLGGLEQQRAENEIPRWDHISGFVLASEGVPFRFAKIRFDFAW